MVRHLIQGSKQSTVLYASHHRIHIFIWLQGLTSMKGDLGEVMLYPWIEEGGSRIEWYVRARESHVACGHKVSCLWIVSFRGLVSMCSNVL